MPDVSVIIPCYNSAAFVRQTIESVLNQTFRDLELIVVNDGSTDNSLQVIQACRAKHPQIQIIQQPNGGVASARNRGFKARSADSRYTLFLDADDVLEPAMLERLVDYLEARPQAGIARAEYRFINETGAFIEYCENKFRYVPRGAWVGALSREIHETPFVSVFTLCAMIPSICLIRREAVQQAGGFDEAFGHHHEDADFFIRIALNWPVNYVPEVLVRRRRHAGQNTTSTPAFREKALSQEKKLYRKWRSEKGLNAEQQKRIRDSWRFKQGRLEPYWAFQRAARLLSERQILKGLRLYAGGFKACFLSWVFPAYFDAV